MTTSYYIFLLLIEATLLLIIQYLKPVNGTAVDKRWKLAEALSKGISNRTKSHNNVQVLSTAGNEEGKERQRTQFQILITTLGNGTDSLKKERSGIEREFI